MPAPAASNGQDDIDALLAGLDAATTEEEIRPAPPELDVFELTDEMALPDPVPEPSFQRVEPDDDLEFAEAVAASTERARSPVYDPPSYNPAPAPQPQFCRTPRHPLWNPRSIHLPTPC